MDQNLARFRGIAAIFGIKGLEILNNAHVTVVGLGGVGSWCTESLVRSGVGHLRIFDHDLIAIHNTNRQAHTLNSTIGASKAHTFAKRLLEINPELDLEVYDFFLNQDNIPTYFPKDLNKSMYVIDAIDSLSSKVALVNYLKRNKFKFITSGGAGGKTDVSKITCADLQKAKNDALLAKLRNALHHDYGFTNTVKLGIRCVFIDQQATYPKHVNDQKELETIAPYFDNNKITFGAFMPATACVGLTIAQQTMLRILKDGQ